MEPHRQNPHIICGTAQPLLGDIPKRPAAVGRSRLSNSGFGGNSHVLANTIQSYSWHAAPEAGTNEKESAVSISKHSAGPQPLTHNHGFNRTPVSLRAAKPGELGGGAG